MKILLKKSVLLALISISIIGTANAVPRGGLIGPIGNTNFTAKILSGPDLVTITAPDYSQCLNQVNIFLMSNPTAILFTPCD